MVNEITLDPSEDALRQIPAIRFGIRKGRENGIRFILRTKGEVIDYVADVSEETAVDLIKRMAALMGYELEHR